MISEQEGLSIFHDSTGGSQSCQPAEVTSNICFSKLWNLAGLKTKTVSHHHVMPPVARSLVRKSFETREKVDRRDKATKSEPIADL